MGNAIKDLEQEIGESVVTKNNALNYKYVNGNIIDINKVKSLQTFSKLKIWVQK